MTDADINDIYLYKSSPLERRAFNLMLGNLLRNKDATLADVFKSMSGLRLEVSGNQKVKIPTSKSLLRKWNRFGIITIVHGRVRLGNFLRYSDILLDEQNLAILRERFGLNRNTVSILMK